MVKKKQRRKPRILLEFANEQELNHWLLSAKLNHTVELEAGVYYAVPEDFGLHHRLPAAQKFDWLVLRKDGQNRTPCA